MPVASHSAGVGRGAGQGLAAGGFDPLGGTPEDLAAAMRSDFTRYGKIVTDSGIRLE